MKMIDYFGELSLCGDCIEDDSFHYATTSCEYVVNGVDAGQAICHAVNNHDKLVDALSSVLLIHDGECRFVRGCCQEHYDLTGDGSCFIGDAKQLLKELGHEI